MLILYSVSIQISGIKVRSPSGIFPSDGLMHSYFTPITFAKETLEKKQKRPFDGCATLRIVVPIRNFLHSRARSSALSLLSPYCLGPGRFKNAASAVSFRSEMQWNFRRGIGVDSMISFLRSLHVRQELKRRSVWC